MTEFSVYVLFKDGTETRYHGVSAIGVGHIKKDLVIVRDGEKPIEVGNWQSLRVEQPYE